MVAETHFEIKTIGEFIPETTDDNVDVEVLFDNGRCYTATFFTLQNLVTLFEKNRETGECEGGVYLWASDMIVVERLSMDVIEQTVRGLIREGEFDNAFCRTV